MPAPRQYIIKLPAFSEYLYRMMKIATDEQKKKLSSKELKHFLNETTMHLFCHNDTFEKQLLMATKLGLEWTILVAPSEEVTAQVLFNTYNQYSFADKRKDAISAMAREKVCAVSSREVMMQAEMLSQNCATEIYHLSDYVHTLRTKGRTTTDKIFSESVDAVMAEAKTMLEVLNASDHRSSILGLNEIEMRVMLTLFINKDRVVNLNGLNGSTRLTDKRIYLKRTIQGLVDKKYVHNDNPRSGKISTTTTFYMITALGIQKVMEYIKYIHEKTLKP